MTGGCLAAKPSKPTVCQEFENIFFTPDTERICAGFYLLF
jgi:hypothetical protein